MSRPKDIDFDTALHHGKTTYTGKVGDWWARRCDDRAHAYAYRLIAGRLKEGLGRRSPKLIVEYACGAGHLLAQVARQFPKAKLIGIDGSPDMLKLTEERIGGADPKALGRTELWEAHLPDFSFPAAGADALIFAFPNICPGPADQAYYDKHGSKHREDRAVARGLGKAREEDPDLETIFEEPETMTTALLDAKVVSRNLHRLLRKGGVCLRAEYTNAPRHHLTDLVQMRMDFEAGALAVPFKGHQAEAIFKRFDTSYHKSKVIEDVYHQTGDELDRVGGYQVNLFKAL